MITVIAPHGRPEFLDNLLANYGRQRGEARLLVVANGTAPEEPRNTKLGITIIRSGAHQADAMNAGLAWLRANGGGAWARFDTDDYYGPGYLQDVEATLLRMGADVVGKRWSFVMFDDGLWRFSRGRENEWAEGYNLTGGTLAAASADVADFPRERADDLRWCEAMRARGARLWAGAPWHYCYDRRGSRPRVIEGSQLIMRRCFGAGDYYGPQPFAAVDDVSSAPLRRVEAPSDDDVMRDFCN